MLSITASVLCLATNLYFEGRGEDALGQYAIAEVTLNRVASAGYPDTICSVVKQGRVDQHGNPIKHKCHFSWYCDGLSDVPKDREAWKRAVLMAQVSIDSFKHHDTFRAVGRHAHHYHTTSIKPPYWAASMVRGRTIGGHIFYEDKTNG